LTTEQPADHNRKEGDRTVDKATASNNEHVIRIEERENWSSQLVILDKESEANKLVAMLTIGALKNAVSPTALCIF
jgi:hypothetical protein